MRNSLLLILITMLIVGGFSYSFFRVRTTEEFSDRVVYYDED